jgi:hypothetical protein
MVLSGDLFQGIDNPHSARVEILPNAAAALALRQIGLLAVFTGQEAGGEAVVGDDANFPADAQVAQRPSKAAR